VRDASTGGNSVVVAVEGPAGRCERQVGFLGCDDLAKEVDRILADEGVLDAARARGFESGCTGKGVRLDLLGRDACATDIVQACAQEPGGSWARLACLVERGLDDAHGKVFDYRILCKGTGPTDCSAQTALPPDTFLRVRSVEWNGPDWRPRP
jgi:hypothetical protein